MTSSLPLPIFSWYSRFYDPFCAEKSSETVYDINLNFSGLIDDSLKLKKFTFLFVKGPKRRSSPERKIENENVGMLFFYHVFFKNASAGFDETFRSYLKDTFWKKNITSHFLIITSGSDTFKILCFCLFIIFL